MATGSSVLAWEIPWTEEPGELQFMGLQSVRHDRATNTFLFHFLQRNSINRIPYIERGLFVF